MFKVLLVIAATLVASFASANANKEFLAKIASNYDCYYGEDKDTDLAFQSVVSSPSCSTGSLCIADVYCRKSKTSQLKNFAGEIKTQIVCAAKNGMCPNKANDCIKDPEVSFAARSGSDGGTFKNEQQKEGVR